MIRNTTSITFYGREVILKKLNIKPNIMTIMKLLIDNLCVNSVKLSHKTKLLLIISFNYKHFFSQYTVGNSINFFLGHSCISVCLDFLFHLRESIFILTKSVFKHYQQKSNCFGVVINLARGRKAAWMEPSAMVHNFLNYISWIFSL